MYSMGTLQPFKIRQLCTCLYIQDTFFLTVKKKQKLASKKEKARYEYFVTTYVSTILQNYMR